MQPKPVAESCSEITHWMDVTEREDIIARRAEEGGAA